MNTETFLNLISFKSQQIDSSNFLVGTIPQKVQNMETIFNGTKTINVTVTYNQSYADMDTIYEGPTNVKLLLKAINRRGHKHYAGIKSYYFINELHANEKRWHMHGQILISAMSRNEEILKFQNIYRNLSKIGRISMKWNNPEYEVKSDEHKTYTQYCFKHSSNITIQM